MVQIFDSKTIWKKHVKPPLVNLGSSGRIRFSTEAVELLKLNSSMKLTFYVDDKDKEIIYFYEDENGIPVRSYKLASGKKIECFILCRPLSLKLLTFFKCTDYSTYRITQETSKLNGKKSWFILKSNKHIPHEWRKKNN